MILQSRRVLPSTGVPHGFSLRDPALRDEGNVSLRFGEPEAVFGNRARFLAEIGLDSQRIALARQVHGSEIFRIGDSNEVPDDMRDPKALPRADGLVTGVASVPVGVLVADCCCLLMASSDGRAVGAFHAGWRGTFEGLAAKAVEAFREEFSMPANRLRVWIGPAICGECYETGEDLWTQFRERWGEDWVLSNPYRVDLRGLNRSQLIQAGVPSEAIELSGLCTLESSLCFSHRRRDRPEGRMVGAIACRQ